MTETRLDSIARHCPAVLPSLLICDFGDLAGEIRRLEAAGTQILHLDVMDGHFVPNLTYGMPIVDGIRRHTKMPMDVHLMISDPLAYAGPMATAGADLLTFHVEAVDNASMVANEIAQLGVGVGVALNPETPLSSLDGCLDDVDMVLVMSVKAGFGGQKFNPIALEKIRQLRQRKPELLIQIDGGIDVETIGPAREAGCDLFVVGSAIFRHDDYGQAIGDLNQAMLAGGRS
ncbi:MAG: ribulose-phosphate 3-epimerase [Planctomycetota bacterium]